MATMEMNTSGTEGDQKDKMLSPSEEDHPHVLNGTSAPLNFSQLTPCQFGISVQSFTPAASSNHKDKSRLAQIKARRRSSIGVRGSPETNSLIRFMAQQKMKTQPTHQTPEHVRSSPFLPRVASTLRQKMASFQSLMNVEESEVCDPMPRQDSNTGGCIKTRDYLCDGNSKENHPPMMTPTPRKRRCLGPREGCEVEIREASAPILHFNLKEQEENKEPVTQVLTQGPLPSSEAVGEAQAGPVSPPLRVDFEHQACSPTESQQDGDFELQSPSRPPPDDPAVASLALPASPFHIPSLPSLLEMKPTGEDDSTGMSTVKKIKRVRFGGPLSPEFFDKNLPPSTPLQKGATPARAATPGGGLQLRSVLKTPQRIECQTPQAQPDLSSPTVFGASPTLAMPRNSRMQSEGEDSEEKHGKIIFPSMEEIDSAVTSDTECTWDSQPLNLNTAFHEESLSQIMTESETKPSTTSMMDVLDEPASLPEKEKQPEPGVEAPAPLRSSNRRKKPEPESESTSEAPARSSSRKRKQPEESEPAKRSTRSAAKLASGKMKMTSTAARRWNRDVDRSLYGSRAYASKNPTLSPITERLSFIRQSPAAQQSLSTSCTGHSASNPETHLNPEMANDIQAISELTVTHALEKPLEDSVTSSKYSKESHVGKVRGLPGQRVRGRGLKKRKVSVADCDLLSERPQDQTTQKTEEHGEDQSSINLEASRETPVNHAAPEQGGADTELNAKTSAHTPSTDSDGKLECHADLNTCPPSGEELNHTLSLPAQTPQRKAKQGRRSCVNSSDRQEQGDQIEEHQMSHEVEENGQGDQAASNKSSSDSQEEEDVANVDLAPWQADFNFEDVFKPVATRGQRSVRRSLRNQSNVVHSDNSAGLAWVPRSSPDSSKEARRRTRGRRLSAALPVQPSVPEETQDNAS
ncbi:cell division cycle-associated protein 2 isoform X2 [Toxotes jaculatrix]|uniref:cell division cycle-associated protein 2 isoform X2 n=1 Tax=Toxotes jaculatrix TaxID=941984 RepID=UPI001B3AB242|nr:cell division cycle-associated protein 2 isoform X2 [Toxotes jaculatrix]